MNLNTNDNQINKKRNKKLISKILNKKRNEN